MVAGKVLSMSVRNVGLIDSKVIVSASELGLGDFFFPALFELDDLVSLVDMMK